MDIETDTAEVRGSSGDGHVIYEIHHLPDCLQQTDFVIFFYLYYFKIISFHPDNSSKPPPQPIHMSPYYFF